MKTMKTTNTLYNSIDGTRNDARTLTHTSDLIGELAYLRPHDPVQSTTPGTVPGTVRLTTAGHGYVAVPFTHPWQHEARALCCYGYAGKHAIYLEEDYEAPAFADRVKKRETVHALLATRIPVQLA